jgi:hypothetical protein
MDPKLEKWQEIEFNVDLPHAKYEISNYGQVKSYSTRETGKIIKGSNVNGYQAIMIRFDKRITQSYYVHRLVAETYIPKDSDDQVYVTHIDYDKSNNHISNLRWVSERQLADHNNKNPRVMKKRITGYKLTESDVRVIKKMLKNEKTRYSQIARQFGITHTQLNRIRKGQNWGHVTIDD